VSLDADRVPHGRWFTETNKTAPIRPRCSSVSLRARVDLSVEHSAICIQCLPFDIRVGSLLEPLSIVPMVASRRSVRTLRCQKPAEAGSAHVGPIGFQPVGAVPVTGRSPAARLAKVRVLEASLLSVMYVLYVRRVSAAVATFTLWTHSADATRHTTSERNESQGDPWFPVRFRAC